MGYEPRVAACHGREGGERETGAREERNQHAPLDRRPEDYGEGCGYGHKEIGCQDEAERPVGSDHEPELSLQGHIFAFSVEDLDSRSGR